jgi:hypothetical protein
MIFFYRNSENKYAVENEDSKPFFLKIHSIFIACELCHFFFFGEERLEIHLAQIALEVDKKSLICH